MQRARIAAVQDLRGIAALLVLLHHVLSLLAERGPAAGRFAGLFWNDDFGAAGVDLFFVISGYVMARSLDGRAGQAGMAAFLRGRIARIVPMFWLFSLLYAGLLLIGGEAIAPAALRNSLTFLPVFDGGKYDLPVLFVGWTLAFEGVLYAIIALALLLPEKARRPAAAGTLMVLVGAGIGWQPPGNAAAFLTNPLLLEFVLGIAVKALLDRPDIRRLAVPVLMTGGFLLAWHVGTGFGYSMDPLPAVEQATGLLRLRDWGVPWAMILFGVVALPGRRSALTRIGDASYSLYLSHPLLLVLAGWVPLSATIDPDLAGALLLVAAIAVGLLAHRWIERPLAALLRGRRLDARTASAPAIGAAPAA